MSRAAFACARCYKRKRKCDNRAPSCSSCLRANVQCIGLDRATEQFAPRSLVRYLEEKIASCEINGDFTSDVSRGEPVQLPMEPDIHIHGDFSSLIHQHVLQVTQASTQGMSNRTLNNLPGKVFNSLLSAESHLPTTSITKFDDGSISTPNEPNVGNNLLKQKAIPQHVTDMLAEIYIDKILPQYPFFDAESLRRHYMTYLNSDPADSCVVEQKTSYFIVGMMMAISAMTSKTTQQNKSFSLAKSLYQDAISYYNPSSPPSLIKLQCTMLLAQYGNVRPGDVNIWHLKGLAMRTAIAIGLHHDPDGEQMGNAAVDLRRKIFWTLYAMDRSISIAMHRPVGIADEQITTRLPQWVRSDRAKGRFINHLRLRQIQSEIYSVNYFNKPIGHGSYEDWVKDADSRLRKWREQVGALGDVGFDWFDFVIATVQIYLHRPCPAKLDLTPDSSVACFEAAAGAVAGYWRMAQKGFLKFDWHGTHQCFEFGLLILYLLRHYETYISSNYTMTRVLEVVHQFTSLFIILSQRWPASNGCGEVYEKIKAKVLRSYLSDDPVGEVCEEFTLLDELVLELRIGQHRASVPSQPRDGDEQMHQSIAPEVDMLQGASTMDLSGVAFDPHLSYTVEPFIQDPVLWDPSTAFMDFNEVDWNNMYTDPWNDPEVFHWAM